MKTSPDNLYLARSVLRRPVSFSLRLSYWDEETETWLHKVLYDLGCDPTVHIIYPNDSSFYLELSLTDRISKACGRDMENRLEKLFWPFVDPHVRFKMEHFFHRGSSTMFDISKLKQLQAKSRPVHIFDQRRMHFLRFGRTDQGRRFSLPPRLMAKLIGKSRDELEQTFIEQEKSLSDFEHRSYLYAALNLRRHFNQSFAGSMPQALPPEDIDHFFVKEICNLDQDKGFWAGIQRPHCLHPYLARYLINYFDNSFPQVDPNRDFVRDFMNGHRQFRWPEPKNSMADDELAEVFGESSESLQGLNKQEITRLYRQKAKDLHPDTGGEHDEFVRLTKAYESLLRRAK